MDNQEMIRTITLAAEVLQSRQERHHARSLLKAAERAKALIGMLPKRPEGHTYTYYVVFAAVVPEVGPRVGAIELETNRPIDSYARIQEVGAEVAKKAQPQGIPFVGSIVVTSWTLLSWSGWDGIPQ